MKIQDILFIISFFILVLVRKPRASALIGILCLVIAIPLFAKWVFFTAERLTWYAGAFFLLSIIFELLNLNAKKKVKAQ